MIYLLGKSATSEAGKLLMCGRGVQYSVIASSG